MKEQAIQKINKIGKVSSVIALIGKILIGVATVVMILATIVCFAMPKDFLTMQLETVFSIDMDVAALGVTLTEAEVEEMKVAMLEEDEEDAFCAEKSEFSSTGAKLVGTPEVMSLTMHELASLWLFAAGGLLMTFVTLCFVSALCKAFRDCQSPFEDNVIKKMQNLGYSLIPWALVSTVTNSISDSLMNNKLSLNFTVDLGVVLIVLVVLVLVYIFKYGAVLQQESDETL